MKIEVAAVIAAAGSSSRMGGIKKEFRPLPAQNAILKENENPLTVLGAAVRAFAASPRVDLIVIVVPAGSETAAAQALPPELRPFTGELQPEFDVSGPDSGKSALPRSDSGTPDKSASLEKKILFVTGGPNRQASVRNALMLLENYSPSLVLIHDGARPWIKTVLIEKIIDAAIEQKAVIPILPITETPKEVEFSGSGGTGFITGHLNRSKIGTAQTPQAFAFPQILDAHKMAAEKTNTEYTDDAQVWGEFIGPVAFIPGDPENKKITFPADLLLQPVIKKEIKP
ncbi:MAG: 2-C-methyl-D-erythritol 4-phosphate cytidylyltransferase [Treponema sp.]|nr:2-C-methyl-D-erythritol 4-phosphate cytidylyltransferase [Treponema sp.]